MSLSFLIHLRFLNSEVFLRRTNYTPATNIQQFRKFLSYKKNSTPICLARTEIHSYREKFICEAAGVQSFVLLITYCINRSPKVRRINLLFWRFPGNGCFVQNLKKTFIFLFRAECFRNTSKERPMGQKLRIPNCRKLLYLAPNYT